MNDILKKYVRFESKKVFAKDSPERPYQLRYKLTILDEGFKNYIADLQAEDINHTITWYEKNIQTSGKRKAMGWCTTKEVWGDREGKIKLYEIIHLDLNINIQMNGNAN